MGPLFCLVVPTWGVEVLGGLGEEQNSFRHGVIQNSHQQPLSLLSAQPLSGRGERIEQGSVPHTTLADNLQRVLTKHELGGKSGPRKWALAIGWIVGDIVRRCVGRFTEFAKQNSQPMKKGAWIQAHGERGWRRPAKKLGSSSRRGYQIITMHAAFDLLGAGTR